MAAGQNTKNRIAKAGVYSEYCILYLMQRGTTDLLAAKTPRIRYD